MNKIFKHKRGASGLKVVCEFAKSHCSSGEKTAVSSGAHVSTRSGFKSLSIALISALTLGIATPAMAGQQFGIGASSSGGTDATAGGRGAKASGSGSTAIGSNTEASGVVSAALGSRSKAADGQSVAVGDRVVARGKEATAIGSDTVAADVSSIAIGSDNTTGYDNKQAFENVRVITADDLKNNKELISALDKLCDSLKYNNNGNCSTTYGISKNNANGTYEISNIDTFYSFFPTLSDGVGSIAIGARTITANKGSTAIGSLSVAIGEKSSAFGLQSKASNVQSLALGAGSLSSGNQATAVGNDVAAIGKSSIAIGNDDLTNTANGTNDGYMNNVMVDLTELNNPNSEIRKVYDAAFSKNNVRLKDYGLIYENNQYRFINASDVGQNITGASGLTYKSDEVGNQNKFSQTISSGIGSIAVGSRSLALGKGATTIGSLAKATGEESTALGSFSKATASKAIAIGRDSIANIENSVALGVSSKTDYAGMSAKAYVPSLGYVMPMANSVGVISVGSSNQQRRIVNLAPGALDTDAVNVSQLKSLAESLGMDGINDSADKMMRYLSIEKATGEAATLQAQLAKEKAFKTYAELRKIRDMMALNENATGGTYEQSEKNKISSQISDLEGKYDGFKTAITAPATATEIGSITTNSSEAEVKALTDKINAYTNSNPFALTPAQKVALKQNNATNEGATGADSIAIGYAAKTKENAANAIAIGKSSNATDINTIAIGNNAKANGESSINIGEGVAADNVLGAHSVLIGSTFGDIAKTNTSLKIESSTIAGTDLKIEGKKIDKSVIIGSRHEIGQETASTNELSQNVIVGEKIRLDNSDQAVTIGSDIIAKDSKGGIAIGGDDAGLVSGYPKTEIQGKGAIAIGVSARAVKDAAMSLGVNSQTTVAQGVALGFNSVASTDKGSVGLEFDTATNTLKKSSKDNKIWKSTAAALSIGSNTITRQITNVAAGSEDTDAVNVAQLKSVSDAISQQGFNVKGKNSAGTDDVTNSIKSGKTVEFASADKYLKISHTATTGGDSKFTFDVNEEELKKTIGATSGGNYSLDFSGDTGANITRNQTNKELKIKGGVTTTTNLSTGNIGVEASGDTLNIKLAKALKGLTSAEFVGGTDGGKTVINGDGVSYNKTDNLKPDGSAIDPKQTVSLGKDGISAGGKTISNVGEAQNANDAVNMKQMNETIKTAIAKNNTSTELKFAGDFGDTKAKNGKITIAGGQTGANKLSDKPNIGVVAEDGKLNIKLAKDIEVDSVTAKDKITVGEGANKITIADGKITGITSSVDPNGELADKLKAIDNVAGKTAAEKAAEKKAAIQAALKNVDNGSVATVGDLKNVTNGLDSVVENVTNITKNVTSITNNVNNITNITNMVANSDDKKTIDKAAEVSKKYQSVTNDKDKQKIAEEAKEVVKANKIKTYNPYEKTVKNNTTIVEAIQNMNERGIKFIHVSEKDNLGEDDNFAFDSKDSRANKIGSIGIGMNAASTAENAIATGTKSEASGADSIATGTDSKASGANAIAMGTGAQAMGKNTISIGMGNKVIGENSGAIGDPTTLENVNGVYAMGNNNFIQGGGKAADKTARDIFAIGNNIGSDTKKVTDKANGSVILGSNGYSNVQNGVALGYGSNVDRGALTDKTSAYNGNDKGVQDTIKGTYGAVSVGNSNATRQIINVAAGSADSDAVNVAQLRAATSKIMASTGGVSMSNLTIDPKTGRKVTIADDNRANYAPKVTSTGVNSVAIGANSVANRANTVSVGSAGNERIIANVADGVAPTDAANMRQLQSVANMVGEVKKDAMAGTASAMAIGNLPQATIPGKGMMAIGAGYYKGQTATALGVSKMSENGRWVFKASASYDSQRNVGAAGAIGFHF